MASIQSLGIGSGLLTNELVDDIIATEREPTENRLNVEEAVVEAKISAYGEINSAVSAFSSSLQSLSLPSTFNSNSATSSNDLSVTATASSVATAGNYTVEVTSLAQNHSIASGAYENLDDIVGTGSLTFRFGTINFDGSDNYQSFDLNADASTETLSINSTNNTLAGVRDAVNSADFGVQATIVDDGSGFRLLFSSEESGANNSLEIVASGDSGIQALNYNSASESASLVATTSQGTLDLSSGAGLDTADKTFELRVNGVALTINVATDPTIDTTAEVLSAIQAELDIQLAANGFAAGDVIATGDSDNLGFNSIAEGFEATLEIVSEGSAPVVTGVTSLSDGFDFSSNNATFSIAVDGGSVQGITLNTLTNSRQETVDAINGELQSAGLDSEVVASLDDSDQLVFTRTESGSDKSIEVSLVDSVGTAASVELGLSATTETGLGGFGLDLAEGEVTGSSRLLQTIAAQDAELTVNGLSVTRESNLVAGVISGTTLNLRGVSTGPVSITIENDSEAIIENIQSFVTAYNDLKVLADELTAFDPSAGENGQGSLLIGDSTLRTVTSSINSLLRSAVQGLSGSIRSLSEIGIATNQNNRFQLSFDQAKFQSKFEETPDAIKALFANAGSTSDSQIDFVSSNSQTIPGTYDVEIESLATVGTYVGVETASLASGDIVIDDDNDNFSMLLNGISADITLTQGTYSTADALAQQLQLQINSDSVYKAGNHSVSVVFNELSNQFELNSNVFGSNSAIEFTATDDQIANTLGFLQDGQGPFQTNQLGGLATATGQSSENFSTAVLVDADTSFELDIDGVSTGLITIPGSSGSPVSYATPDDLIAAISTQITTDGAFLAKPASTAVGEILLADEDYSAANHAMTFSLDGGDTNVEIIVNGDSSTTSFGGQTPGTLANSLAAIQEGIDNSSLNGLLTASLDVNDRLVFSTVATGAAASLDIVSNGAPAEITGTSALTGAGFDFASSNASFDISLDGEDALTITLDTMTTSVSETTEALQSALDAAGIGNRLTASVDGSDNLILTRSSATGAATSIEISNVNAEAISELGLSNEIENGLDGFSFTQASTVGRDETTVNIDYEFDDQSNLGRIVFSSDDNSDVIEFDNVSTNAASTLGVFIGDGTLETAITGLDVSGTINGIEATGSGQLLRAGTGNIPAKPGFYLNAAVGNLASSTTNDTFTISVDGITSTAITLGSISNTNSDAVAASLQSAINGNPTLLAAGVGVTVEFDQVTGGFGIISNTTGPTSSVTISSISGSTGTIFGFATGAGLRGSTGSAAQGTPDDSAGISLRVTGGAIGERGEVSFVRGIADQLDTLIDSFLDNDGLLSNRTSSLNKELENIAEERLDLDARIEASEARLRSSFLANDLIISSLNTTADFLSSQLRLLEGLVTPQDDD